MLHISKNWEGVFDFQYKVALGQCTVVGKGDFNYFSIFDFMESEQTFDDV